MSENKLVGSLVLRTIDIDPTRSEPLTNVGLTLIMILEILQQMHVLSLGKMLISELV